MRLPPASRALDLFRDGILGLGPRLYASVRSADSRSLLLQTSEPIQCTYARHEEVLAAAQHIERFNAAHKSPDRVFGNGEGRFFFLQPNDWIALVT